jgi:hypothetical protein
MIFFQDFPTLGLEYGFPTWTFRLADFFSSRFKNPLAGLDFVVLFVLHLFHKSIKYFINDLIKTNQKAQIYLER